MTVNDGADSAQSTVVAPAPGATPPPSSNNALSPPMLPGLPQQCHANTKVSFEDDDALEVQQAAAAQPEPDPSPADDAGCLSISTRIEYSSLPKGETREVFSLVTIKAKEKEAPPEDAPPEGSEAQTERQAMDVVCVLDVSGSMGGQKIRDVQKAVQFIIEQADKRDRISIVTFNQHANRVTRLQRMTAEGKDEASVSTLRLGASGGTSIAAGLDCGLQVMEQRRQRNNVSAILLLTDGQDRSTHQRLPALLRRAEAARCQLYAFGFGADHDAALLSSIAEQAQTPFTFVEDTDRISEAFAGAVGGLTSVVAQQVVLSLNCLGDVRLKDIHTGFATQRISDTQATTTIPDLFAGESRDILVELVVPAAEDAVVGSSMQLLQASARYSDLGHGGAAAQTAPATMSAERVEVPQPEDEPDEEVSAQRARIEVTRALQAAAQRSDEGAYDEACLLLEDTEKKMASKKKTRMHSALEEELQDAKSRMKSRSAWEGGGRAEVRDATQMHKLQRCTNVTVSKKSCVSKSAKKMYVNSEQKKWIASSASRAAPSDDDEC